MTSLRGEMDRRSLLLALVAVVLAADVLFDIGADMLLSARSADNVNRSRILAKTISKRRGGIAGRKWQLVRNDPMWLFRYALRPDYIASPDWRAMFRIRHDLFVRVCKRRPLRRQRLEASLSRVLSEWAPARALEQARMH